MQVQDTPLPGLKVVGLRRFADPRGAFTQTFDRAALAALGITDRFERDAHVFSHAGVLRGLHYTVARPHAKLVWVSWGRVWDVVVDIRLGSASFGRHFSIVLSGDQPTLLYVPAGFAHGYCVTGEAGAHMHYKLAGEYDPADEAGILWNDPALALAWPVGQPVMNERDGSWPLLAQCRLPSVSSDAQGEKP